MTLVTLRGGLTTRAEAIALGCQLEARGHALSVKDGALQITAGSKLTPADIAAVKAQKTHLICLAAYVAPEGDL
jgi:hypothetical protein